MDPIPVMVNGIPGKVACTVARHIQRDPRFRLIDCSLTGPEIQEREFSLEGTAIRLIRPEARDSAIQVIRTAHGEFLTVDYTHPSAVNPNAEFYCRQSLPFVMGTTGGDRQKLEETVHSSAHRRRGRTQHGQADRRVSGNDGICGPDVSGLI